MRVPANGNDGPDGGEGAESGSGEDAAGSDEDAGPGSTGARPGCETAAPWRQAEVTVFLAATARGAPFARALPFGEAPPAVPRGSSRSAITSAAP